jgi:hypothetical protein
LNNRTCKDSIGSPRPVVPAVAPSPTHASQPKLVTWARYCKVKYCDNAPVNRSWTASMLFPPGVPCCGKTVHGLTFVPAAVFTPVQPIEEK